MKKALGLLLLLLCLPLVPGCGEEEWEPELIAEEEDWAEEFYFEPISDELFARMNGKSFRADCTLPREDLRYVHVLHVDLKGYIREGELVCNRRIAQDLVDIFRQLFEEGYPIGHIRLIDDYGADDEASMEANNTSCFNFRFITNLDTVSKHGLGLAVDVNPLYNPYVSELDGEDVFEPAAAEPYLDRTKDFPCKIDENDLCYQLFTAHGFDWGGDWLEEKDYQHFELPDRLIAQWYEGYSEEDKAARAGAEAEEKKD